MTRHRLARWLRWAGLLLLGAAGAFVYLAAVAPPALADNCGTLADCFAVAGAMANAASAAATIAPIAMAAGAAGAAGATATAAAATPFATQARIATALGQAPLAPPLPAPPVAAPPPPAPLVAAPPPPDPLVAAPLPGASTTVPSPPPPGRVAAVLRGEPVAPAAPVARPPARSLVAPSAEAARATVEVARALRGQVDRLRADPGVGVAVPGTPHPVLRASFEASTLAYEAAGAAHDAYDAAYQAVEAAPTPPAAAQAQHHAGVTHGLAERANTEYAATQAADEAAQQGGPLAVEHAAQAAAHAEQAAVARAQAVDAAARAVAAATAEPPPATAGGDDPDLRRIRERLGATAAAPTPPPPAAGGPPELPPPGPPAAGSGAAAGEPDPHEDIAAARDAVAEASSRTALLAAQIDQVARVIAPSHRPAGAGEQDRRQIADAALRMADQATDAAFRAASVSAMVAEAVPADRAVAEAARRVRTEALATAAGYETVQDAVRNVAPSWEQVESVVGHARRTVHQARQAARTADATVQLAATSLPAPAQAQAPMPSTVAGPDAVPVPARSAEFPVLVGDLVLEWMEPGTTARQEAVRRALADLIENRTYGDGFTVRVRTVTLEGTRTTFEVDVLHHGRVVGNGKRTLMREGDLLVVKHNMLEIADGTLREHGFGSAFNEHLERWYRASGVDHITLRAARAGTYVWARRGYRWVDEGQARQILAHLARVADDPATTATEADAAHDVLDRARRYPWGHPGFPTIAEIAVIGRPEHRIRGYEHLGMRVLTIGWDGRKDLR